jgi:ribonuclease D
VNILVARTKEDIDLAYERLATADALGCDTETSGLSPRYGKLFSIQFSDGDFNVLVPVSENVAIGRLTEILADKRIVKIFHNARFDIDFLHAAGHSTSNVFDTMIAEKVLTRGANQSASLAETLYRYFAVDLEKSHRTKFTKNWNGIWTDELVDYALSDVFHLPRLMSEQRVWMEKLGLSEEFRMQMHKAQSASSSWSKSEECQAKA